MLTVQELHSGYGRIPILNGINLKVAQGEVLGILGHNGMGKTTLIKTLMGFIDTTHGTIELEGRDITRASPNKRARAGFGYVPQGRDIFPRMTVEDNLRFAIAASGNPSKTKLDEILQQFQRLVPIMGREGGALSGGEQQILAIARCLCASPKLMFLDEPTEGIQPSIIEQIIDLLSTLRKKSQLTIVLVEQNLEFVSSLSDRVAIIQKGKILNEFAPSRLEDAKVLDDYIGVID
tara:strand:- start:1828 stop:2532 length:705 start_codon:yes stop_codon:yes gene_type:complete